MRNGFQCLACGCLLLLTACGKPATEKSDSGSSAATPPGAPTNALALLEGAPKSEETNYSAPRLRTETSMRPESFYLPPSAGSKPVAIDKKTVKLQVGATTATAYYFQPQGVQPAVGIVALHARAGLTDNALREAENLARIGCGVLALDYFEGAKPATPPEALHLMATLGGAVAQQKIAVAQAWLRETQRVGKLVVLGWGDGGVLALNAGLTSTPPDVVATFYGDLPVQYTTVTQQLARNKVAVLGFFAKRDAWVTPARVNAFDEALSQAGVDHLFVSFAVAPEFVFDPNPASQSYAATARNTLHDFMSRRGARF